MPIELYKDANHCCVMFTDLVSDEAEAVQANQFLIVNPRKGTRSAICWIGWRACSEALT